MMGMIMAIIDTSIVNVALNDIAGTLGASLDEIGWVVTAYILAMVIVMPLNGWLTARFGRRNFYAACILLFTISSFLCGTATELWQLVLFRVLQGLGGGALQPTAQAILFESYPPEKRGGAQAIFGLGAVVGPTLGPTLGGLIVDNYSWPLIFFINIPIGIAAFLMTLAFIKDQSYVKRSTSAVDWFGLALLIAGLGSLQYVLERGQREDWFGSQTIVTATAICVCALVAFVIRELNDPQPLVDLTVFKSWSFSAGNVIGLVSGFGVSGLALMLPLYFQNVMGFDALTAGFALIPSAAARAISLPIAARMVNYVDKRVCIAGTLVIVAVACWMMGGLNMNAGLADSFWPRALQGFGLRLPVRSAHEYDAGRHRALETQQRRRRLHAIAATSGAASASRSCNSPKPGVKTRRTPRSPQASRWRTGTSRICCTAREPNADVGAGVQPDDAQRRDRGLQRRLPHVHGHLHLRRAVLLALARRHRTHRDGRSGRTRRGRRVNAR